MEVIKSQLILDTSKKKKKRKKKKRSNHDPNERERQPNLNIDEGLCWVGSPTQSLMSARMDEAESRLRTSQI